MIHCVYLLEIKYTVDQIQIFQTTKEPKQDGNERRSIDGGDTLLSN
jgi:hypothetical protein